MSNSCNQDPDLSLAKRLAEAQAEFDEAAKALVAANRSAREAGQTLSAEMQVAAERLNAAQQKLKEAKAASDRAGGGRQPVELTPVVITKIRQLFSPAEQGEAIRLLERECARNLPLSEHAGPKDLERVRLAVLKLSAGDLAELRRNVELAKVDWRDPIVLAEQPEAWAIGLAEYATLDDQSRAAIAERDERQYAAWLNYGAWLNGNS